MYYYVLSIVNINIFSKTTQWPYRAVALEAI